MSSKTRNEMMAGWGAAGSRRLLDLSDSPDGQKQVDTNARQSKKALGLPTRCLFCGQMVA